MDRFCSYTHIYIHMLPDLSHETNVHNSLLIVTLDNEILYASEKYIQHISNESPETVLPSNLLR